MEKAVAFRTIMNKSDRDHPSEDSLERFLLNQADEEELEIVESHFLACEGCVTRLETLEFNLKATKLALQSLQAERVVQPSQPAQSASFFSWFTLPRFSMLGGSLAACAIIFTFLSIPRQVQLTANRDDKSPVVAAWLPLDIHLDARTLPVGPLKVEIVDARGSNVWHGVAVSKDDQIVVRVPALTAAAAQFFVRVSRSDNASPSLLREFSIQTKSLF